MYLKHKYIFYLPSEELKKNSIIFQKILIKKILKYQLIKSKTQIKKKNLG